MPRSATAAQPTAPLSRGPDRLASLVKRFLARALQPNQYCRVLAQPEGEGLRVIITVPDFWGEGRRAAHHAIYDFLGEYDDAAVDLWVMPDGAECARAGAGNPDLVLLLSGSSSLSCAS